MHRLAVLVSLCALAGALLFARAAAAAPAVHRVAIIVGANDAPPGRSALRYAHDDAKRMADVLQRVGHFAAADVHVLLEPRSGDLAKALDDVAQKIRAAGDGETLFLFYYSGHSDGLAVYPHGEATSLADLRDRIGKIGARVRVGILDTCRGGSWTQAKGLTAGPPLDPVDLMTLTTEGTALVSSSSGFENAHEADAVQGSFFTHHLAAGLLGAADRSGDGSVTLQEAFDYAKERTVRDSARLAITPQHPSYDVQLRGRQDIVLAQIASSPSALEVQETQGPLEVIHLASGLTVLEIPPGTRTVRVALPPGRYIVRRVTDGKTYSREIEIPAGSSATLAEGQLEIVAHERLALKGDEPPRPRPIVLSTTLPHGQWELELAAGVRTGPTNESGSITAGGSSSDTLKRTFTAGLTISYGITDRFQWLAPVPAFAYRFGEPGKFEVVPRLGATSIGYSTFNGVFGTLDAGVGFRAWTSPSSSVVIGLSANSPWYGAPSVRDLSFVAWSGDASLGYTITLEDRVSLNVASRISGTLGLTSRVFVDEGLRGATLSFGSVQSLGYRPLPLVQIHLARRFSLDAHASWSWNVPTGRVTDRYLGGFTWDF